MSAGRPTKFTPEAAARVLQALKAGNFRSVAARWAGVSERSLRHWIRLGKTRPRSKLGHFRRQVLEAEQSAEMRMVALVMKAAATDAKHAEWWLERKASQRWGKRPVQPIELSGRIGVSHEEALGSLE